MVKLRILVNPTSGNVWFDKMVVDAAKSIKGTWKSATIHGVNVDAKLEIPLTIGEE